MKDLIAYCGLDCEACDARIATVMNDDALREKTAALWTELNGVPIAKENINCMGCRADGVKTVFCENMCKIRQCAVEKGLAFCGDCAGAPACETLSAITANNPDAAARIQAGVDGQKNV